MREKERQVKEEVRFGIYIQILIVIMGDIYQILINNLNITGQRQCEKPQSVGKGSSST